MVGGQNGTSYFNDVIAYALTDFCVNQCNNNGECIDDYCKCTNGFTGMLIKFHYVLLNYRHRLFFLNKMQVKLQQTRRL
jgi:hypothetical protein